MVHVGLAGSLYASTVIRIRLEIISTVHRHGHACFRVRVLSDPWSLSFPSDEAIYPQEDAETVNPRRWLLSQFTILHSRYLFFLNPRHVEPRPSLRQTRLSWPRDATTDRTIPDITSLWSGHVRNTRLQSTIRTKPACPWRVTMYRNLKSSAFRRSPWAAPSRSTPPTKLPRCPP